MASEESSDKENDFSVCFGSLFVVGAYNGSADGVLFFVLVVVWCGMMGFGFGSLGLCVVVLRPLLWIIWLT